MKYLLASSLFFAVVDEDFFAGFFLKRTPLVINPAPIGLNSNIRKNHDIPHIDRAIFSAEM